MPGADRPIGGGASDLDEAVPELGTPVVSNGIPLDSTAEWPQFRGPHRDAIADDPTPLARTWPPEGPPRLWAVEMGEGYAGAAVRQGRVFVLDYDESAEADTLRCLSLRDGQEIWRNSYPVAVTRNHGMSRTVPSVVGDRVITLGPRCHVACWDVETGVGLWLIDLVRDFGAEVPRWYAGQCPLVDQGRLILAPCGKSMLIAIDLKTGDVVWESPNPRNWRMTHVSIMPMDFEGRRTYVYCGSGGVAGIDAEDGSLVWDTVDWPEKFATSPSPVILPEGRILLSSGYDNKTGSLLLQLAETSGQIVAETEKRLTPKQFNSEQQTPILYEDHLYGVRKRGGGQLVCMDTNGNELWNSGRDRFGHGPYMIADGMIFVMSNRGELTMAEASPNAYKRLAASQVIEDGHDAWGPMALVDGRLIVRDMTRMVCLDVAAAPKNNDATL